MRLIDADRLCEGLLNRWSIADTKKEELIRQVMADVVVPIVVSQPTIETQKWIPVSERLPKSNGIYNVTRNVSDGFECSNITDTCYFDGSNTWHDDTRVNHGRKYLNDVVAWMPLPKPYEEGNNEVN